MANRSWILGATLVLGCSRAEASPPAGDFIVHEWGTFTSFQDVEGVSLDGLQHETEALPSFVHSRLDARTSPLAIYGDRSRDVPVRRCRGKMETPVIYFHSSVPRRVKVHVELAGLLTQWYPAASGAAPAFVGGERHDLGRVTQSSLDWLLDVTPPASSRVPADVVPTVEANSDWQKAREVDAALVRSVGAKAEAERYVFYRGLMPSVTQPRVVMNDSGAAQITNDSSFAITAAFVLEMNQTTGRFAAVAAIAPGAQATSPAATPYRPKREVVAEIERAATATLVAHGLYADEARAMVRTWSETWFSAVGSRVLYIVPRPIVDAGLPLTIHPAPDTLIRVMVGRVETMTPREESKLVADVGAASSGVEAEREAALARMAQRGRFLEPAVRGIARRYADPRVAAGASVVLARLAVP